MAISKLIKTSQRTREWIVNSTEYISLKKPKSKQYQFFYHRDHFLNLPGISIQYICVHVNPVKQLHMVRNCFAGKHPFILTVIFSLFSLGAFCQAKWVNGLTNEPDTSYTTWSAFNSTRKSHPHIKIR